MALYDNSVRRTDNWADFYEQNKTDGGPIKALFDTSTKVLAERMKGSLNNVSRLTEFITGSSHGNMILIPGKRGTMQLVHHGFACNTTNGFALAFAHRNLGDCTAFKTISREEMVAPVAGLDDDGERTLNCDLPGYPT
jgi:hypothetical protein